MNQFDFANIKVSVNLNEAQRFALYDNKANAIIIYKKLTDQDLGYYRIEIVA